MGAAMTRRTKATAAAAIIASWTTLSACAAKPKTALPPDSALEVIYVLRSIREPHAPTSEGCTASRTGFEPFPADAERFFSFWSVQSRAEDGRVVDAKQARVAELRGCFGPTDDRARQKFYAGVELGAISFRGSGECLALGIDVPEAGLFPVRCQLVLSSLPTPFVGGFSPPTRSRARPPFGDTDPSGYTQASIATIRLWKRDRTAGMEIPL